MKIKVVHILPVDKYPPVLSIIHSLKDLGHDVQLITTNISEKTKRFCDGLNITVTNIDSKYNLKANIFIKFLEMFRIRKCIWNYVDRDFDDNSLIWIFDNSLKFVGKKILTKPYVVHFFELYDQLKYHKKIPFFKINLRKVCENAKRVIHCEQNRAFISMARLKLENLPIVIPNKPYYDITFKRNSEITSSKEVRSLIEKLKDKKIILYQGILTLERPLEEFIKAVDKLGDDYAFVVLSSGENIYRGLNSKNYYFIPFISPPYHLEVTSHAYIGVLSYYPTYKEISSPLNALYCAPNKLFEYSMFGIPMIGNNIPGLNQPFEKFNCGMTVKEVKEEHIIKAIRNIEKKYCQMSANSMELYNSVDLNKIISEEVLNW
ncbi:hypothetical protein B4065_1652 [Caldibacillus thermoamylovorans]|uniref:hypothetical protein n=1 Tax=Caldibacillus thermoamylovorans TaxID=35841 RepID=UPI0005A41BA2|nr:hypothetical protein [Caldibacillus thermoamylovorans]KIO68303.1 hypothetical protein B4065_1652 [Caldibacillus thermoamylovorans]